MTSLSSSKAICVTCGDKNIGVFKCEGCSQKFCRKHSNEHRDLLTHQLDEIVVEHDSLLQTIVGNKDKMTDYHSLIEQINEWERDSIVKIQQTANEARQQIEKLISTQNEKISLNLHDLAERLRKARENDDFVETDLRQWVTKLQELKFETMNIHHTITVCQDPFITLIGKLNITSINQRSEQDDSLVRVFGSVQIEDNGHVAIQRDLTNVSYIRGRKEYSFGKYKIKFNLNKINLHSGTVFGIISKIETFSQWPSSCYGWSTDDTYYCGNTYYSNDITTEKDMKGEISFNIELMLDCDNRQIRYFNEQTKKIRQLNVNLKKCSFPWQIFFYLHPAGDRVQLL